MVQIKFILVQLKCKAKIVEIMISKHKMIQLLIRAKKPKNRQMIIKIMVLSIKNKVFSTLLTLTNKIIFLQTDNNE